MYNSGDLTQEEYSKAKKEDARVNEKAFRDRGSGFVKKNSIKEITEFKKFL